MVIQQTKSVVTIMNERQLINIVFSEIYGWFSARNPEARLKQLSKCLKPKQNAIVQLVRKYDNLAGRE